MSRLKEDVDINLRDTLAVGETNEGTDKTNGLILIVLIVLLYLWYELASGGIV